MDRMEGVCAESVQFEISLRGPDSPSRSIDRGHVPGTTTQSRHRKTTVVAVGIEHTSSRCQLRCEHPVFALVKEPAGLLAGCEVDGESKAILDRGDLGNILAGYQAGSIFQPFLSSNRALAPFNDRSRCEAPSKGSNQSIAHSVGARCVKLEHAHLAVSIDHNA